MEFVMAHLGDQERALSPTPQAMEAISSVNSSLTLLSLTSQGQIFLAIEATFTKFPGLPLEIRREIWKLALPNSRVITITKVSSIADDPFSKDVCRADVPGIASGLLHATRESREVALGVYAPFFHSKSQKLIYLDLESDTLNFANGKSLTEFVTPNFARLAHLWGVYNHRRAVSSIRKLIISGCTDPLRMEGYHVVNAEMGGLESVTLLDQTKIMVLRRAILTVTLTEEQMAKCGREIKESILDSRMEVTANMREPKVVFLSREKMDALLAL